MIIIVTGGSGSGKSAYAEKQITTFENQKRYYIATMENHDLESQKRIDRHRRMRADKGFITIECPRNLENIPFDSNAAALLECMSNLTANELFAEHQLHSADEIYEKIKKGIDIFCNSFQHVVIVTNEVFSDGNCYDEWTDSYLCCLGKINQYLSQIADQVVEVVYTIPVIQKGLI